MDFDKLLSQFGRGKVEQGMGVDGALLLGEFVEFLKEAAKQSVRRTDDGACLNCGYPIFVKQVGGCPNHPVRR